jgi:hypothetical protein
MRRSLPVSTSLLATATNCDLRFVIFLQTGDALKIPRPEAEMNVFELIVFLLACAAFGFVGYLVSPRYGWFMGLAVLVLILLLSGSFKPRTRETGLRQKNQSD